MRKLVTSVILVIATFAAVAQVEATSPTYSFSIKKDIKPPILFLEQNSVRFIDDNNNGALDASENAIVEFSIKNTGIGDAHGLELRTTATGSTQAVTFPQKKVLTSIKAGATRDYQIEIETTRKTRNGTLNLSLEVIEPNGFGLEAFELEIPVKSFASPDLQVADYAISGEGRLEKKVPFNLDVLIQNLGGGKAEELTVRLELPSDVFCLSGNELVNQKSLPPGDVLTLKFTLVVNQRYSGSSVPIKVSAKEKYGEYGMEWTESFDLNLVLSNSRITVQAREDEIYTPEKASLSSDVDINIPSNSKKTSTRYAVVIGNEDYSSRNASLDPDVNVDYAINDAMVMAEYFESAFGMPEENIKTLTDATAGEMRQALAWLSNVARAEKGKAELYFYYSGHGLPTTKDRTPYLIPVDVSGAFPELGIALSDLYSQLTEHECKRATVILDACFTGGARNEELIAMKGIRVQPKKGAIPEPMVVFTSSSGQESSGVYHEKQHGFFTYFLLKEIQTRGIDVDYGTLATRVNYEVDRTAARFGNVQRPDVLFPASMSEEWKRWTVK